MKDRYYLSTVLLAALVCGLEQVSFAQTAEIIGRITDPSNAVIPEASVSVTSVDTGIKRNTTSNEQGYYTVPLLQPGDYKIFVQKEGFKTAIQPKIRLVVQQVARLDFVLEVGEIAEVVNVTAEPPLLQTSDTSQGQVIASKQIVELPLNGRDYSQLILLSTGATELGPGARIGQSEFSSNGQRSYQNNFILDGLGNDVNLLAYQSGDLQVIRPNLDAIQEFKVQTNAYSAEFGRGAGAVVNVAIKSGTNELHGSAFEFLRNDNMEANNFFNNRSGLPRPEFRQNQFGFAVGGPIRRDTAFLFGDYQGTRIRQPSTRVVRVPTALERQGDFSQTLIGGRLEPIFDPATFNPATGTRQPFPGNIIPRDRFDPVAGRLIGLYPEPNAVGTANFISNFSRRDDTDQFDIREDTNIGDSDKLFVRYSYQRRELLSPPPLPGQAVSGSSSDGPKVFGAHSVVFNETHAVSPRLINSFRAGYTRLTTQEQTTNSEPLNQTFGIRGTPPDLPGLAELAISGFQGLGDPGFLPRVTKANTYEVADTLLWTRGTHSFKAGITIRHVQSTLFTVPQTRGNFSFTGNFTHQTSPQTSGIGLADFLLGIPTTATLSSTSHAFYLRTPFGAFLEDSWHVTSRLTLNLGLRYDRAPWYRDRYGNAANLFLEQDPLNPPLLTDKDPGVPGPSLVETDNNNFAPRVGLAYQISPKNVLRLGYGVFYGAEEPIGGGLMLQNNPPFLIASSFTTDNLRPNLLLREGFPPGAVTQRPQRLSLISLSREFPAPYSQQWNVTLERQVAGDLVVSAAYVGATGTHLYQSRAENVPPPGPGDLNSRRPIQAVNVPTLGVLPIGAVSRIEPRGRSSYHSLQLRSEKRFSQGLFFLISWIYSKAIDDAGWPLGPSVTGDSANNPKDLSKERALATFDVRNRLVISYGYELPFGRGRAFLHDLWPAVNHLVGGWQIQSITTIRSGLPFTVVATGNASNTVSGNRPDLIGNPTLPSKEQRVERFFNTEAFQRQRAFTFGNAGRNILTSDGLVNFDFSIFKNIDVHDKLRLQFRAESFNAFNTPSFGFPGSTLGTPTFGVVTSTTVRPRQYQLGLKVIF